MRLTEASGGRGVVYLSPYAAPLRSSWSSVSGRRFKATRLDGRRRRRRNGAPRNETHWGEDLCSRPLRPSGRRTLAVAGFRARGPGAGGSHPDGLQRAARPLNPVATSLRSRAGHGRRSLCMCLALRQAVRTSISSSCAAPSAAGRLTSVGRSPNSGHGGATAQANSCRSVLDVPDASSVIGSGSIAQLAVAERVPNWRLGSEPPPA
jgi:hypothetical protein